MICLFYASLPALVVLHNCPPAVRALGMLSHTKSFFLLYVTFKGKKTVSKVENDLISPWTLSCLTCEVTVVVLTLCSHWLYFSVGDIATTSRKQAAPAQMWVLPSTISPLQHNFADVGCSGGRVADPGVAGTKVRGTMEAFFGPGPAAGVRLGPQKETWAVPTLLFLKCSDREMHQGWVPALVPQTLLQNKNNIIKKARLTYSIQLTWWCSQTATLAPELFPPSNYPTWPQEHVLMALVKVTKQIHKIKKTGSFIFHGIRRQVPRRGNVYSNHACHSMWLLTRKF